MDVILYPMKYSTDSVIKFLLGKRFEKRNGLREKTTHKTIGGILLVKQSTCYYHCSV